MISVSESFLRQIIREEYLKIRINEEQALRKKSPKREAEKKAHEFIRKIVKRGKEAFELDPTWYKKLRGELYLYNQLANKLETDDYLKRAYSRKFPGWTQKDFQYLVSLLPLDNELYAIASEGY
jgi:hypothetical protein